MKQKIILDKNILFKDGQEIKLSDMQVKILRTLKDNLLHSHEELIKKADILRTTREKDALRNNLVRLNRLTKLTIKPLKGLGYFLEERIFVND